MQHRIKYIAPILEPSGYGQAARDYCKALISAGVDLTIEPMYFGNHDFSSISDIKVLAPFIQKNIKYDTLILHSTPEHWPRLVEEGKTHIGITLWETDSLHPSWSNILNTIPIKELWLPNQFNIDVFSKSCLLPMYKVPYVVDVQKFDANKTKLKMPLEDRYIFYSIFQWSARKNPEGLLSAYFSEFTEKDKVLLILKTYTSGFGELQQREASDKINAFRRSMGDMYFPPLFIVTNQLNDRQIVELHNSGDCYVSPHRSEGWGLPITEAMAAKKPVIATEWSGNMEYCNVNNSLLVGYSMLPVRDMTNIHYGYNGRQNWAEPSIASLKWCMRTAYDNREDGCRLGLNGYETVKAYTSDNISKLMMERLKEIR